MNQLTNRNFLQVFVAVLLFVFVTAAFGQDSLQPIQFQNLQVKKLVYRLNTQLHDHRTKFERSKKI